MNKATARLRVDAVAGMAPQNPRGSREDCPASLDHAGGVIPWSHLADGWMWLAASQVAASPPQGQAATLVTAP